jgi:hypothetical protein
MPPLPFVFGNSLARKQIDEEEKTKKKTQKCNTKQVLISSRILFYFWVKLT